MITLLRLCSRLLLLESKRQAPVVFGAFVLCMFLDVRWMPELVYFAVTWLIGSQVFAFRLKERQENWESFFFALTGRDVRLYPSYLYVFAVFVALVGAAIGVAVVEAGSLLSGVDAPPDYLALLEISVAVLFLGQLQLLASEILPIEQIVLIQRLSLVVVVVAARLLMDAGLNGDSMATWIALFPAAIFAFGGVIPVARLAARAQAAKL